MTERQIMPWAPQHGTLIPVGATSTDVIGYAQQLSKREMGQIASAFEAGHYEMVSTFVWAKAMAGLRKQLATLGMEFIGEMLQRPDISASSDAGAAITDIEAIGLAADLGIVSATESMRLRHAHEAVTHFSQRDPQEEEETTSMTAAEADICIRACVANILGQPRLEVAQDFAAFRKQLEEKTFQPEDEKVTMLTLSPYFYRKTTLSVLLSLLKTASGAQLEHATRNTNVFLPVLWPELRKPEKWQTGQAYAELYAEGKKAAVGGLKEALVKVAGFDFVPENLRSSTFTAAAKAVLEAHDAMNNFYNEPAAMIGLAALGSTIPSPAFPVCMAATLAVRLGNFYGRSFAAQEAATKVLRGLSKSRWTYYLDDVLPMDRRTLFKLSQEGRPVDMWMQLVSEFELQPEMTANTSVRSLLSASIEGNSPQAARAASIILRAGNPT